MIARRSFLIYIANAIGGVLGYVGILAVARLTPNSQELLGIVGFGLGFVGSFFVLAGLGIPTAHIKRVSEGESLGPAMGTFALLKALQVALSVALTLLAVHLWLNVLGQGFETPQHFQVILIMLVYFTALAISDLGITTFNARLETAKSQTSFLVGTVVRVAGMFVVAAVGLGAPALAWAYALGAGATAIAAFLLVRHYEVLRPTSRLLRSYLRYAFPLALPAVLGGLSANIDKVVIQLFWSATEVGYYFTMQRVLFLLAVITSGVSLILFPSISRYHAQDDYDMLRQKSRGTERYLSMILAPLVAFLFVYPEGVIHVLVSDDFLPAADILRIFAVATFVLALVAPRRAVLAGIDRPDLAGIAALAGALVTLALYPILIPRSILGVPLPGLAAEGAAVAFLVGNGVLLALGLWFTYRLVGDRLHRSVAIHLVAVSATALAFAFFLDPSGGVAWRWFDLLLVSAGFLAAYLGFLVAVREFRRRDLRLFLDILNPVKMARYVRDELLEDDIQ